MSRQGYLLLSLLFHIALEALTSAIKQEKYIKGINIREKEMKLSPFRDDMIIYGKNTKEFTKEAPRTNR